MSGKYQGFVLIILVLNVYEIMNENHYESIGSVVLGGFLSRSWFQLFSPRTVSRLPLV